MKFKPVLALFIFAPLAAVPLDRVQTNELPPAPIGGYKAIQENINYPAIARDAGTEGIVVIQAYVDENGQVTETTVVRSIPHTGLDEAAIEGIRRTPFIPARQHGRPVGVWLAIPVDFQL